MKALVFNCSPVRNGATAKICRIVTERLSERFAVQSVCIDDYDFAFCRGCRSCHTTARCILHDDVEKIMAEIDDADRLIFVAPSYWADIPGQFKAFIDRCTPWCNTHEPYAKVGPGKKAWTIALRTGPSMRECDRIVQSIEHFLGHLEIECCGHLGLCSLEWKEQVEGRRDEILAFCEGIR